MKKLELLEQLTTTLVDPPTQGVVHLDVVDKAEGETRKIGVTDYLKRRTQAEEEESGAHSRFVNREAERMTMMSKDRAYAHVHDLVKRGEIDPIELMTMIEYYVANRTHG